MKSVLFKSEGSHVVGLGHVSRTTSLIRALPPGWSYRLIVNQDNRIAEFLTAAGISYGCDWQSEFTNGSRFDRIVFDQQTDDEDFLRQAVLHSDVVCGLDYRFYEHCDLNLIINLVNQHPTLNRPSNPKTRYFESLKYAILASRFLGFRKEVRSQKVNVEEILVIFGGSDLRGNTLTVLRKLVARQIKARIRIVLGPLAKQGDEIKAFIDSHQLNATIHQNPEQLPLFMAEADLAFSGCGTTCFELCYIGTPVIVVPQTPAESHLVRQMAGDALVLDGSNLDLALDGAVTPTLRAKIVNESQKIFDGRGIERIFELLEIF